MDSEGSIVEIQNKPAIWDPKGALHYLRILYANIRVYYTKYKTRILYAYIIRNIKPAIWDPQGALHYLRILYIIFVYYTLFEYSSFDIQCIRFVAFKLNVRREQKSYKTES